MADAAHGGDAAAETAAGLPQFDLTLFASQIFWLAITFGLLYLLLSQALLPKLESVLEARARRIREDLDAAALANGEAQRALTEFERAMASARSEARALADSVRAEAEAERAAQVSALEARLEKQLADAEARLQAQRASALESARRAGEEAASVVVARLLGERPAPSAAAPTLETAQ